MTETETRPEAPVHPVGVIETDAFCDQCGFNLRTQRVWLDERLKIPVCRCPDCGRHQAAGKSTTVTSAWLRRLATLGLMFWMLLSVGLVVGAGLLMFCAHVVAFQGLTSSNLETRDGRLVEQYFSNNVLEYRLVDTDGGGQFSKGRHRFMPIIPSSEVQSADAAKETIPADQVVYRRRLARWLDGSEPFDLYGFGYRPHYYTSSPIETLFVGGLLLVPHVIVSIYMACASWFWPPARRWLWLLLPVAATGVAYLILAGSEQSTFYTGVERDSGRLVAGMALVVGGLQVLVVALGLLLGRPIARVLTRTFVPPGARPHLAFLWHADGKVFKSPAKRP